MTASASRSRLAAGKLRVQNQSTQQTVKATPGTLYRVIVSNANAAVQTLTLFDGSATLIVIQVPATTTLSLPVEAQCTTSILATPSHANIDALFIYD